MEDPIPALATIGFLCFILGLVVASLAQPDNQETFDCEISEWNASQLECTVKTIKTEKVLIDKETEERITIKK